MRPFIFITYQPRVDKRTEVTVANRVEFGSINANGDENAGKCNAENV